MIGHSLDKSLRISERLESTADAILFFSAIAIWILYLVGFNGA